MFRNLYAGERSKIFHYTLATTNESYALQKRLGFHSDLHLPPRVLIAALQHVLSVNGTPARYVFQSFEY